MPSVESSMEGLESDRRGLKLALNGPSPGLEGIVLQRVEPRRIVVAIAGCPWHVARTLPPTRTRAATPMAASIRSRWIVSFLLLSGE